MRDVVMAMRTSLIALALSVALPVPPVGAAVAERASFTWSADCTEIASGVSVPVENLDGYVPEGYRILGEETGTALLNVGIGRCTNMVVDGDRVKDAFTGFVAVFIEGPAGGIGRYYLWSNGTSGPVDRRLRSLGLPSIRPKGMSLSFDAAVPASTAEGIVPRVAGDQGGYSITLSHASSTPAPASIESSYWHQGHRGLVEAAFSVTFLEAPSGPATIRAEAGTVMSELIGGDQLDGGALLARFHFDATFSIGGAVGVANERRGRS